MLDIKKMMNEEVKEELNKVVINGVLVGEFNDDTITKVMNILKGKNVKLKASAPTVIEKETEEETDTKEWKEVPRIGKVVSTMGNDFVTITKKGNIYRAYVEYGTMKKLSKSEKSYKNWKKYMHGDLFRHDAVVEDDCEDFHFIFNPIEKYGIEVTSEQLAKEFCTYLKKKDDEYRQNKK